MQHANKDLIKDENVNSNNSRIYILMAVAIGIIGGLFFIQKSITSNKPSSFLFIDILIYTLLAVSACFYIRKVSNNEICIEKLFLICIIPLGIIYTLLIPPGIVPDEWVHMQNTFSLSSQIMGKTVDETIQLRECEEAFLANQVTAPNNDYYDYIYSNIISIDQEYHYKDTDIHNISYTQLFSYFPSVIGVILGRLFHLGIVSTVYLGRLLNFIFYVSMTYAAIKKLPFGKILMFVITMLPMACHQMFSLSYDAVINSSAFFAIAYGMFFVYQSNQVKLKVIVEYGLCGILLLVNKGSAYSFILVIPILAKYFNPNGDKIAKKTKVIIFLLVVISLLLLNYQSFTNNAHVSGIESVSGAGIVPWSGTPSYTLSSLLSDFPNMITLFINTLFSKGNWYISTAVGSELGWLAIYMPVWLINSWLGVLVVSAFTEKSHKEVFTYEHKILYFLIALGVVLIVMLAMALAWTPMGYSLIEGVQGRYYIPVIFLLLICLQNSKIYLKENLVSIVICIIPILSIITVHNLILLVL